MCVVGWWGSWLAIRDLREDLRFRWLWHSYTLVSSCICWGDLLGGPLHLASELVVGTRYVSGSRRRTNEVEVVINRRWVTRHDPFLSNALACHVGKGGGVV